MNNNIYARTSGWNYRLGSALSIRNDPQGQAVRNAMTLNELLSDG